MLRRGKDKKFLPGILNGLGGKIEPREGIFEAAKREILEEANIKVKNLRIKAAGVGGFEDDNDEYHFKMIVGDWEEGNPQTSDGELYWMSQEEILNDPDLLAEHNHGLPKILDPTHPIFTYKAFYTPPNNLALFEIEE